jgi:cytidine deaminase
VKHESGIKRRDVSMLTDQDKKLIAAATEVISKRYRNDWQEVGAAMLTRDGRIVTGVNIDAYIGRIAVCAEAIAIGRAITEKGDCGIDTIVAVRHPKPDEPGKIAVVSPCGICRELIHDYDAKARVIVPDNGREPKVVSIGELLPNKYRRGSE